ncbi:LytTR family DNA-binding domain-containing protein [Lactiplantibacillus pentosus]|uniref:LytTR family DNA-binding domain-containing protein n=1 Tax=Lactiplantibacillus pentosus TaxID=1589 RepID=UPI001330C224|nr:LytTR family DNA-binding domain-containing protein [Lactiplantibacillus pentosus]
MVHSQFERDEQLAPSQIEVLVKASQLGEPVQALMLYIDQFQTAHPTIIPLKTSEQLMMVKTADIIMADVQQGQLLVYTTAHLIQSKEPFSHLRQRLANLDFVQVSKHAFLNLNHLLSLSDSFSGNMTAVLTNQIKTEVSRKYVKTLMKSLGI